MIHRAGGGHQAVDSSPGFCCVILYSSIRFLTEQMTKNPFKPEPKLWGQRIPPQPQASNSPWMPHCGPLSPPPHLPAGCLFTIGMSARRGLYQVVIRVAGGGWVVCVVRISIQSKSKITLFYSYNINVIPKKCNVSADLLQKPISGVCCFLYSGQNSIRSR